MVGKIPRVLFDNNIFFIETHRKYSFGNNFTVSISIFRGYEVMTTFVEMADIQSKSRWLQEMANGLIFSMEWIKYAAKIPESYFASNV
jgi:hypothetical protein